MKPTRRAVGLARPGRRRRDGRRGRPSARRRRFVFAQRLLGQWQARPVRQTGRRAPGPRWRRPRRRLDGPHQLGQPRPLSDRPHPHAADRSQGRRAARADRRALALHQGPAAAGAHPGRRLLQRLLAAGRLDRGGVRPAGPGDVGRRGGVRAGPRARPRAARSLRRPGARASEAGAGQPHGRPLRRGRGHVGRRRPQQRGRSRHPGRRDQRLHPLPLQRDGRAGSHPGAGGRGGLHRLRPFRSRRPMRPTRRRPRCSTPSSPTSSATRR